MLAVSTIEELELRLGQELGVSDWHEVTQEDIKGLDFAPLLMDQIVSRRAALKTHMPWTPAPGHR